MSIIIAPERGGHRLETTLVLPRPRQDVFPFFADAANLELITPPSLRFRIATPLPIAMREGALIDYRLRLHGLPFRWQTEITHWEPPFAFVDEQVHGPYRWWRHEHVFEERDGRTIVHDIVRYGLPGGRLVSRLAHRLFVRHELERIFSFRIAKLHDLLGALEANPDRATPHAV